MIISITKNINKILILIILIVLIILYYKMINKKDKFIKQNKIMENLNKINILLKNNNEILKNIPNNINQNTLQTNNTKLNNKGNKNLTENNDNAFKKNFFSNIYKKDEKLSNNQDYLLSNIPVTPCKNSYTNINKLVIDNPYQKYFNRRY